MTAALCRVLRHRGEQPLPFKGQNMSLNAWVDKDGGEMAYSQALQAWAADLEPEAAMNPVLLKPQGDSTSEVIHLGRSVGLARAEFYYRDWFRPGWAAIRTGLGLLQESHPGGRLVLEGAGSPVEVNLQPGISPICGWLSTCGPAVCWSPTSSGVGFSPSLWAPWRFCGRWNGP